ncbi:MAG: hypothetical protein VYE40_10860 [Myxococcota bacterium]|nr:hypothetical protein [Myxococcota bacterium]
MKKFLCVFACSLALFTTTSATACVFGPPSLWVIAWPIPDDREAAVPAPTDTQIWFAVSHRGNPWDVTVRGPDGEDVEVDIEDFSDGVWVMLTPRELLLPRTTYTVTVNISGSDSPSSWSFTTGEGESLEPAPGIENLRYFVSDQELPADDCGKKASDRQFVAFVDEPLVPRPFLYELELHFDGAPGVISEKLISYDWGVGPRPHGIISAETSGLDPMDYPCMTLHVTDVTGQKVSSSPRCVPTGCLEQFPQFMLSEDHETHTESFYLYSQQWDNEARTCPGTPGSGIGCASVGDGSHRPGHRSMIFFGLAVALLGFARRGSRRRRVALDS